MENKYKPSKEELKVINDRFAKEPYESVDSLYVFPAMIVDTLLTAYYTKMHPDFLKQCVKDLAKGVPFLIGHDKDKLPMAKSFKGTSVTHNDEMEVFAKFFMQKDLEVNGVNTDAFMRAYLGGTIEDVSIGFAAKRWECSICEEDIRSLKCPHWPGKRYNAKDEEVDKGGKICFAWVKEPAGPTGEALLEISAVYKGAVPKAGIRRPSEIPKFSIELAAGKKLKEIDIDTAIVMNFSVPASPLKENPEEFNIDKFFAGGYTEEELKNIELSMEDIDTILAQEATGAEAKKLKENKTAVQIGDRSILQIAIDLKEHPASELLVNEAEFVRWTRAYINGLPNASFAVVEPAYTKGETRNKNARHLPHHNDKGGGTANENLDLSHLRNALARMNQVKPVTDSISTDELRSKANSHLEKHRSALTGNKGAEAERLQFLETNNGILLEQISGLKTEIDGYKQVIDKSEIGIQKIKDTNLKLQEKVKELESFAGIVKTYREELIKEILDLGVKLHGNSYDKDTNEKMLKESTRTLDEIKKIGEQYLKELDVKFPRKQTAGSSLELGGEEKQEIPDKAFEQ